MTEKMILVGGGGHCRSVIEVIESTGLYRIEGILDTAEMVGRKVLDYEIIATDAEISRLAAECPNFLIAVGQIKSHETRMRLFGAVKAAGAILPPVMASTAMVSKRARIGEGTIVMHQAMVNAGAEIGPNCIINTRALVEHDAVVGAHCHISTAAVVNGAARIGEGAFIGSGAVLREGVKVGREAVIGCGAAVVRDVAEGEVYKG